MSSRTSSRSTLTTVPSTMSPSLKYLMVSSIAARKASSDPRSSTVTLLRVGTLEGASMLLVMWVVAPVGMFVSSKDQSRAHGPVVGHKPPRSHEAAGCVDDREPAPYRGTPAHVRVEQPTVRNTTRSNPPR